MSDVSINDCARRNVLVSTESSVVLVARKESRVVTFLNDQKRYSRFESVFLQFFAGALNGAQFFVEHFIELALAHTVSEVDNLFRLASVKMNNCEVN